MSQLTLDYPRVITALLLLWTPRSLLRAGPVLRRRRRRTPSHSWTHAPQDGTVLSAAHEFAKVRNYVDLSRAAVGGLALVGGYGLAPAFTLPTRSAGPLLAVLLTVVLVAVLAQTIRRERRGFTLSAPVFFVAGLMLILPPGLPGLCAFAVAWALVPVVPNSQGFISVQTVIFVALGVFLGGLAPLTIALAIGSFLPVVLSLLTGRHLYVLSPRGRSARS